MEVKKRKQKRRISRNPFFKKLAAGTKFQRRIDQDEHASKNHGLISPRV